jgi:hypothetical protein
MWQAKQKLADMRNQEEYEPLPPAVLSLGSAVVDQDEQADLFPFFDSFLDRQDTEGLEGGQAIPSHVHMDMLDETMFARVTDFKQAVRLCVCTFACGMLQHTALLRSRRTLRVTHSAEQRRMSAQPCHSVLRLLCRHSCRAPQKSRPWRLHIGNVHSYMFRKVFAPCSNSRDVRVSKFRRF